jgi:hypothetical protein
VVFEKKSTFSYVMEPNLVKFSYGGLLVHLSVFSLGVGEILQNFGLKDLIPIHSIFHGKNGTNLPNFKEKKMPNCQIFMISSSRYPRIQKDMVLFCFFFFFWLLSYLVCSQIWLNHLMDGEGELS